MKFIYKIMLAVLMFGTLSPAMAQDNKDQKIWHRTKTFRLGFSNNKWTPEGCSAFKPNYGFSMSLSNTYFVHKRPIAGMLKFGIEATWFDFNYVNYKASPDWTDFINPDGNGFGVDDELDEPNLGSHQLDAALGVGISVHVAPFAKVDNSLNQLRAKVYCNFMPSFSAMLISEPDDTRFNYAFVPYITCGLQVQWKVISLFVEGRWGSANYKIGGLDDDPENYYDGDHVDISNAIRFDKIACRNAGIRAGIGFSF